MIRFETAVNATGLLRDFSEYGVIAIPDVHPALHLTHLFGEGDDRVRLALALAVRAVREGSVCIDLESVASDPTMLGEDATPPPAEAWPDSDGWLEALSASPCVTVGDDTAPTNRPLRLIGGLLYLERYWRDEEIVSSELTRLVGSPTRPLTRIRIDQSLDDTQRRAVEAALAGGLTIVAGGPGTGKTRIISEILAGEETVNPDSVVGLAAPTGKAAARMTESVGTTETTASTIHRLLGWRPDSSNRFAHDRHNPLPHDLLIIDETSMVSTTLMARLLEALKPSARLVLVGDPNQLTAVEGGAVLADLTAAPSLAGAVTTLKHNYRFAGQIAAFADAVKDGDTDAALQTLSSASTALLRISESEAGPVLRSRAVDAGTRLWTAARDGDRNGALQALDSHRLLCAHRSGWWGVSHWSHLVRSWLESDIPGFTTNTEFYVGRPLLVTKNIREYDLYNGDTGVVMASPNGSTFAVFGTGSGPRDFSPWVLEGLESVDAMTIHKSQGSQFAHVSVVLPPSGSPLLTRELLYTAVTRARESVVIVGDEDALVEAIENPTRRASGLASRL